MNHKDLPFDFVKEFTPDGKVATYATDSLDQEYWTVKNDSSKIQFMFKNGAEHTTYDIRDFAVYRVQDSEYIENQYNTKEILLKEPLRKLPDGTKDEIIKRDGKWYVERNIAQITLNGTESWQLNRSGSSQLFFSTNLSLSRLGQNGVVAVASDKYSSYDSHNHWLLENKTGIALGASSNQIRVKDYQFSTASDFANHLKSNPMELIYPLRDPVYEPLNVDMELNLYNGDVHLSNNSSIPATMRVVIDRVINIAKEKIKIAEANPTIENISQARFWINQIEDSSVKDQLQNLVNDITGVSNIGPIERKTVTTNADLYIKSKNTLSLSLDTNNIQFDNFSGIEDMEMNSAVELAVNSSLPYQVKATLPTGITNADKSNILNTNILNIKSSLDSSYKTFTSIGDELILLDSQPAGSKNLHNIDIMLKGGLLSKADIYKTTVKFEVEQK